MSVITCARYHDISCGHRVVGHETKCRGLHGHNYRVHFTCEPEHNLDQIGRVVDFGVLKSTLCAWLEEHWDHKMLLWEEDPLFFFGARKPYWLDTQERTDEVAAALASLLPVPFNPTAENMALYLLNVVGPQQLIGTGVYLKRVVIEETRKCSATAELA